MTTKPKKFTPDSLVEAITSLFKLNNYTVDGPEQVHGAEIDLIARPQTDPFAQPIYIEATVEYVDNTKYGKDVTKLAMVAHNEPQSRRVIVSSSGFTKNVRERAKATGIECLTYEELFSRFEQFEGYVRHVAGEDEVGSELAKLSSVYEEPSFDDARGRHPATPWLDQWLTSGTKHRWIVVTGEYGTGKTALTKVLQYRWTTAYGANASRPIPFRIELRDFTHQFDARGLLHHFLDNNHLGHVSLDFVFSLIRAGRIVLLLDGYDEMAQYMHARERRACLEALASLSSDGARGILTSRPNYFSEAEELQLFETLYRTVGASFQLSSLGHPHATDLAEREKEIDSLLETQFVDRFERNLRDLSVEQTESLVRRMLESDPDGQAVVLGVLNRVFRTLDRGDTVNLSGKPVIISYLLEVVESLKDSELGDEPLSEWEVYNLIVQQLMLRDHRRAPMIEPRRRMDFLEALALKLSDREHPAVDEQQFRSLVSKVFSNELKRVSGQARVEELERYYADLRSSATLTRTGQAASLGWKFSHASLREYFLTRHLLTRLSSGEAPEGDVPVSDPMRIFLASLADDKLRDHEALLAQLWTHGQRKGLGAVFALLWDGVRRLHRQAEQPVRDALQAIAGEHLECSGVHLQRIALSSQEEPAALSGIGLSDSVLVDIDLRGADLEVANFSRAMLENVSFRDASLDGGDFTAAYLGDVDFSGAIVSSADFRGVEPANISIHVEKSDGARATLTGTNALGFLNFHGAHTDHLPTLAVVQHHPSFVIVDKILRRLSEQGSRQRRGLVQRGAAHQNPQFAEDFVAELEAKGMLVSKRRDLVTLSEKGRDVVARLLERDDVATEVDGFLRRRLGPEAA